MATPPTSVRTSAYQCAICKEQYSRPDHLIRHVRTHTKQRPFVCTVCTKAFARQDLLKRHSLAHDTPGRSADPLQHPDALSDGGRYGPRVRQACRSCALKKLKCNDEKPCRRCMQKNIPCHYEQSPEPPQSLEPSRRSESLEPTHVQTSYELLATHSSDEPVITPPPRPDDEQAGLADIDMSMPEFDMHMPEVESLTSSHLTAQYDVLGCTLELPSFGDYIQQNFVPDISDLDLALIPDSALTPDAVPVSYSSCDATTPQSPVMGMGTEAYRGSMVRKGWDPGTENSQSETESLELPYNPLSEGVSALHNRRNMQLKNDSVTVGTRDRFLTMIYSRTPKSIWRRMSATFESLDVLRGIAHHALTHMQEKLLIPILHTPSLDLNEQRPEFLGTLWAYGAISLPSATMRRFGYGLQELVRLAINQTLEEERATIRELGIAQAFYLQLYLGFWSAISSKIEIAESSSMLGATILRRGNMFRAASYMTPQAILSLEGLSLQQKWATWIEQESRIRLVYFAVLLDAEVSVARKINPLFACSEIATPLPSSRTLWDAATADEWFSILTHNSQLRLNQPHTAKVFLRDPHLLKTEQSILDTAAAAAALLAGCWTLVHDYRLMETLQLDGKERNNFVLNSRYAELVSLIDQLRMELADIECPSVQVALFQELILLHLNAAYYEISAYSGRGTPEDAQSAKPYVQWWFRSHKARQAIFHAGQIFRHARTLCPSTLMDMSVIALYHATETMWVWGLLQRTENEADNANNSKSIVALDGDENAAVTKFVRLSRGHPGVTSLQDSFIALVEPASVSDLANDIIRGNWGSQTQPWTTSEVSRLVQGFSRICRQKLPQ